MTVKARNDDTLGIAESIDGLDAFSKSFRATLQIALADPDRVIAANKSTEGNPISITTVVDASKWTRRMIDGATANGDRWLEGVKNPSRSFKEAGKAAVNKWKVRTQEAIADNRFEKGLNAIDEDAAIRTAEKVGASGYSAGIQAREEKIGNKIRKMQPMVVALKKNLDAMKSDTATDAEAKAVAAIRGMREIGKAMRG